MKSTRPSRPRSLALIAIAAFLATVPTLAEADVISVVGTLSTEGAECPAMRGDDGRLYTLTPRNSLGLLQAGARVRVVGTVAEISTCQQGITIGVMSVEPAN